MLISKGVHLILFSLLFLLLQLDSVQSLRKFYMEDDCTGTIDMAEADITAGRLSVTRRSKYRSTLSCYVTIKAPLHRRIIVVFRDMDIEWEAKCDDDYVSLHDGPTSKARILHGSRPRMCGHRIPPGSYVTSGEHLTVFFKSDIYKQDNGFEIVFTAFHKAQSCFVDELHCNNGRCIAASLSCNNFNNCGDDSDECQVDTEVVVAIVLSVFLLTVVGVGVILLYKKRHRKLGNRKQRVFKAAVIEAAKLNKNTVEIYPCEACSLKIVTAEKKKRFAAQRSQQSGTGTQNEAFDGDLNLEFGAQRSQQSGTCTQNEAYVGDLNVEASRTYIDIPRARYSNTCHRASI